MLIRTTRRALLKQLLTCAGALLVPVTAVRCGIDSIAGLFSGDEGPTVEAAGSAAYPAPYPELGSASQVVPPSSDLPRVQTPDRVAMFAANRRKVWAWLRMFATTGAYALPTSEAAYLANLAKIDVAMPLNGGTLQGDGSWLQEDWKIAESWPQSLPNIARGAGQLYMPGVNCDREGILTVLDDAGLQDAAANNLVNLAGWGRFDSPWDGVYLNLEGIPFAYQDRLSDFLRLLSFRLRRAGFPVGVSTRARTGDSGPDYDDAYTYDYAVIGEVADYFDMQGYDYWSPDPRSIAPYWWLEASIQYALSKGIPADKITLGLATFSRYWPVTGMPLSYGVTFEKAIQLADSVGATANWVEENENGIVRERYARVGTGHIWVHNGATYQYGLNLIDQYGLLGNTWFSPGLGDANSWQVIGAWRELYTFVPHIRMGAD